jgi:tellurite resistance protein TerC
MAILGLRSLYFLLADIVDRFVYLKTGLAVILSFVGVKLLMPDVSRWILGESIKIPTALSLGVIVGILTISVVASLIKTAKQPTHSSNEKSGAHD